MPSMGRGNICMVASAMPLHSTTSDLVMAHLNGIYPSLPQASVINPHLHLGTVSNQLLKAISGDASYIILKSVSPLLALLT